MKSLILILTVALVASNINHICGLVMEGHVAHLGRCKCLKHISLSFCPKRMKHVQVIPKGIHCRRTEVILTLINGWKFCIDPNTPWVIQALKRLTKSTNRVSWPTWAGFLLYDSHPIQGLGNHKDCACQLDLFINTEMVGAQQSGLPSDLKLH